MHGRPMLGQCSFRIVFASLKGELIDLQAWPNDIKLNRDGHQPEDDLGQRDQPGGLAGFAGLVPAAGAFGLALVAAAGPSRDQVALAGDLEGQVGGEAVQAVRGKSIRSR